jgi:predicted nuclease of restriction endonuclease-like (RecB) superfamily
MVPEPQGYASLLGELKSRIAAARLSAALAVNKQMILLYWSIGREILVRQTQEGWGARVIDRLADDLRRDFPEMSGLSARNLKYMRALAEAHTDPEVVQQVVAQLPWGHNVRLLESVKDPAARLWYARQAIEHGWSRNVLVHQIDSALFARQGKALTNFVRTLPAPQSELAQQIIKDPYSFEFLGLDGEILERDLERSLLDRLSALILELGKGFSFVGSQFPLEVGGQDYRLDLLFYHLKLRCFVVFELKVEEFQPEFAGKMNFYLSAVDDAMPSKGERWRLRVRIDSSSRSGVMNRAAHGADVDEAAVKRPFRPIVSAWRPRALGHGGYHPPSYRVPIAQVVPMCPA